MQEAERSHKCWIPAATGQHRCRPGALMRNIKSNRKEPKFYFRPTVSSDFYKIRRLSLVTLLNDHEMHIESLCIKHSSTAAAVIFRPPYVLMWVCLLLRLLPLHNSSASCGTIRGAVNSGIRTEQVEGECVSVCTCSTRGPCRAQSNSSMWFLRSKQWIDFVILATTENLLTERNKPGIKACLPARVFNLILTTSTENACNNDTAATQQYKTTCTTEGGKTAAFYWTLKPKTFHIDVNSCDFQQEARNQQHASTDNILKHNES